MDGKTVTNEKYTGDASEDNFCQTIPIGPYIRDHYYAIKNWRSSAHYVWPVGENAYDTEAWYFLVRRNYLVGYDILSRRCLGLFDQQGFKSPGARPSPFSGVSWVPIFSNNGIPTLLVVGSKVYMVDFVNRNSSVLLDAGNDGIVDAGRFGVRPGAEETANRIAVTLGNKIRIFDGTGKPLFAVAYPHDPQRWNFIEITCNKVGDRVYLISEGSPNGNHGGLPDFLDEYDGQGHLLRSYSHLFVAAAPFQPRWVDRLVEYSLPLGPLFLQGVLFKFQAYHIPIRESWRSVLLSLSGIGILLAATTFLWARKTGLSTASALGWAAVSFLFGPAGLLTFRLATDWPVQVPCPACRRTRPIDTDRCPHCAQGWALPERNGTEILDIPSPLPNP
jgi:hypothetical protein